MSAVRPKPVTVVPPAAAMSATRARIEAQVYSQSQPHFRARHSESTSDNICPVCHDVIEIFAVGPCDHPVCSRCSTRMRVLCEQMDCPICRSQMPQVAFVYEKSMFRDISLRDCIPNRKYKIFFEDKDVEDSFLELLEYRCRMPSCQDRPPERSFAQLQTHMRREHQLFSCELCVTHLRIFPFERKFYDRKSLAIHRRVGDEDDRSYKGHPLCEFCDTRYNDNDDLLKHLRKDHFFCHFCDQHGCNAYYDQYPDLVKHFSESHFLCTEGECANTETRFTHAFASEIDLKAHRAAAHNRNLSKAQSREVRTIEVDFQMSRRRPGANRTDDYDDGRPASGARGRGPDRSRRGRDFDADSVELHRALEASKESARAEAAVEERIPDPVNDFPALNGAIVPASLPPAKVKAQPEEDFPSLSSAKATKQQAAPSLKAYSTVMNRQVEVKTTAVPVVKESKPVVLGSVPKIRDRPSTAPRNNDDEYPTLGGNLSSHSLRSSSSSSSWGRKSPSGNVLTTTEKSASTSRQPERPQLFGALKMDEKQFPKLASEGPIKNNFVNFQGLQSNLDWTKRNGNGDKKKPKTDKYFDATFELPESYYRSFEETTGMAEEIPDNQTKMPGFFDTRSRPAPVHNPDDFPGLPVRTNKVKKNEDLKKAKPKVKPEVSKPKVSKEDSKACLGDIALALIGPAETSAKSSSSKATLQTRSVQKPPKPLDWFDNPPDLVEEAKPKSRQKSNTEKAVIDEPSFASPIDDFASFPSLHTMSISIQQPKPPPGFTPGPQSSVKTTVSAPPGFDKAPVAATATSTPASLPPGFLPPATYTQPADFKLRNLQLIDEIRDALAEVEDGFTDFKVLSSQFRQGIIDAFKYYQSCQRLMGRPSFAKVFPELLALLPDITRQRDLWAAHKSEGSMWGDSESGDETLSDCKLCGQVVLARDAPEHESCHPSNGVGATSQENNFMVSWGKGGVNR